MKLRNKKGFTIVELVIVIAIIAILAAVLIPTFSTVIEKANISSALQEAKNAVEIVAMERQGDMGTMYIISGKYVFKYTTTEGLNGTPVKTGEKNGTTAAETDAYNYAAGQYQETDGTWTDAEKKAAVIYGKTAYSDTTKAKVIAASSDETKTSNVWGKTFVTYTKYDATTKTNGDNNTDISAVVRVEYDGVKFVANNDISSKVLVLAAATN